ncbi:MAG: HEPN domain-containing protein [candidate division NC10 bacterium]|nr:HEPN domain-containing protein [candidate division NC10 bacterium]
MTNQERAEKLMVEASQIQKELQDAIKGSTWNLAVRRAQEVIELVLKAILTEMGVDFPKIHDVAPLFRKVAIERGLLVDASHLDWLEEVSARLAMKRAPAFYFEAEVSENEAQEAAMAADRVLAFGSNFLKRLRGT